MQALEQQPVRRHVRVATPEDFPAWMALVEQLHERCVYQPIPLDRSRCLRAFAQCNNSALGTVLLADGPDGLEGFLIGIAQPLWWANAKYATDLAFYASRSGAGASLAKRFLSWAKALPGVAEITLGVSSGIDPERTGQLYERLGLRRVGGIYTMMVKQP